MEDMCTLQTTRTALARLSNRRGLIIGAVRLSGGAALAMLPVFQGVLHVAAQDDDDTVMLTGTASEVSARPGAAAARGAASEAAAERGAARVQAAAALAAADSENGALAQSPVAAAAADPDTGAIAQSANAVASATSDDDESSGVVSGGRASKRRDRGRKIRRGKKARRVRVRELPATGMGVGGSRMLSSLLAAGAALAAGGALALRSREESGESAPAPVRS